jgi:hypothetical protein
MSREIVVRRKLEEVLKPCLSNLSGNFVVASIYWCLQTLFFVAQQQLEIVGSLVARHQSYDRELQRYK